MSRKQPSLIQPLVAAAALAFGASGAAIADGSSMARFGGDSYAYFNRMPSNTAATPDFRQSRPNGLTERELQALSSSNLSTFAAPAAAPAFARAAADPTWRQSHPNGLTDRELQALSSSSLAQWQMPEATGTATAASGAAPFAGLLRARSAAGTKTYE